MKPENEWSDAAIKRYNEKRNTRLAAIKLFDEGDKMLTLTIEEALSLSEWFNLIDEKIEDVVGAIKTSSGELELNLDFGAVGDYYRSGGLVWANISDTAPQANGARPFMKHRFPLPYSVARSFIR